MVNGIIYFNNLMISKRLELITEITKISNIFVPIVKYAAYNIRPLEFKLDILINTHTEFNLPLKEK